MAVNLMKYYGHTYSNAKREDGTPYIAVEWNKFGQKVDLQHNLYYTDHNPQFASNFLQGKPLTNGPSYNLGIGPPINLIFNNPPVNLMDYFYTTQQSKDAAIKYDSKTADFLEEKCLKEMRRECDVYALMGIKYYLPNRLINNGVLDIGEYQKYLENFKVFKKIYDFSANGRKSVDKKLLLLGSYLTSSYTRIAAATTLQSKLANIALLSGDQEQIKQALDAEGPYSHRSEYAQRKKQGKKNKDLYLAYDDIIRKMSDEQMTAFLQIFDKVIDGEVSKLSSYNISKKNGELDKFFDDFVSTLKNNKQVEKQIQDKMKQARLKSGTLADLEKTGFTFDFRVYLNNSLIDNFKIKAAKISNNSQTTTRKKSAKAIENFFTNLDNAQLQDVCKDVTDKILMPYFEQYFNYFGQGNIFQKDVRSEFRNIVYSYVSTRNFANRFITILKDTKRSNNLQGMFGELYSHIMATVSKRIITKNTNFNVLVFNTGDENLNISTNKNITRQSAYDTLIVVLDKNNNNVITSFGLQMKTTVDKKDDRIYKNEGTLNLTDSSGIWDYLNPTGSEKIQRIIQFVNATYPLAPHLVETAMKNLLTAYSDLFGRIIYQDYELDNGIQISTANSFYIQNTTIIPASFLIFQTLAVYCNGGTNSSFNYKYKNEVKMSSGNYTDGVIKNVDWSEGVSLDRNAFQSKITASQLNDIYINYTVRMKKDVINNLMNGGGI